jgi:cytoskeletal protein RodZ
MYISTIIRRISLLLTISFAFVIISNGQTSERATPSHQTMIAARHVVPNSNEPVDKSSSAPERNGTSNTNTANPAQGSTPAISNNTNVVNKTSTPHVAKQSVAHMQSGALVQKMQIPTISN